MIQSIHKKFSGAVAMEWVAPKPMAFVQAFINFSAAPTTSENFTLSLVSGGVEYTFDSFDPSNPAGTDFFRVPAASVLMDKGDKIKVTYANTENATIDVILRGLDSSRF